MAKVCIGAKMWMNADECEEVENYGGGGLFPYKKHHLSMEMVFFQWT